MISAVVLTKNEKENIIECLKSLLFCDEIILIDDYSSDGTLSLIQKSKFKPKIKIFKRKLDNDFAEQRNFGLKKTKNEWVLFIDADERVTEALASEIKVQSLQLKGGYTGFYLSRIDNMWGKQLLHGEPGSIKLLRLAKRDAGKWKRSVHEVWDVEGGANTLRNPLLHYPHPTLSQFIKDVNKMSSIHAQENQKERKSSNLFKIVLFPTGHYFKNFILKLGFLDGMQGFVFALIMSFHSFLAWSKLLFLQNKAHK